MKRYLLDYKSWKTAVVESARLENTETTMLPLMEATVEDIQKLLPAAELGKSGADGKIGPNTLAAIYKALSAAKPVVTPVGTGGTGGTSGTGGTAGTAGTNLPEVKVTPNMSTAGTAGTAGTTGTASSATSVGTSGTSGKVTLTSQQKIDAAKAALQKAEDEAKGERRGDKLERRIERKEGVVNALKSKLKVADS